MPSLMRPNRPLLDVPVANLALRLNTNDAAGEIHRVFNNRGHSPCRSFFRCVCPSLAPDERMDLPPYLWNW